MKDVSDSGATSSVGRREYVTPPPPLASVSFDPPSDEDDIKKAPPCSAERVDALAGARAPSSVEADVREAPPCSAQRVDELAGARAPSSVEDDIKKAPPCCSGESGEHSGARAALVVAVLVLVVGALPSIAPPNANRAWNVVESLRLSLALALACTGALLFALGRRRCRFLAEASVQVCRRAERDHLRRCAAALGARPALARALVAHRGFHGTDDSLALPLENTLDAYETAWAAGVTLCECDVGLTSDGVLVLCHDANFRRLALGGSRKVDEPLVNLTLRDVKRLRLASGVSAPTLEAVLVAARELSPSPLGGAPCQLVVELKGEGEGCQLGGGGDAAVAAALVALLEARPELAAHVAVVMSFDAPLCRACKRAFATSAALGRAAAPRVLLLTRLPEPGKSGCVRELAARFFGGDAAASEAAARELEAWVRGDRADGVALDGAYVEYEPKMERDAPRLARVIEACGGALGVWINTCGTGDALSTAHALAGAGVSFVNSDFQATFLQA